MFYLDYYEVILLLEWILKYLTSYYICRIIFYMIMLAKDWLDDYIIPF